jgi:16S rRNA (guanine966-N2)-methyltransferase
MSRGTRITGGELKGRLIGIPREGRARYTSSMVRQALFNRLGDIEGASVLDLYAGAGSFSCEALSRGAARATCVEVDREMLAAVAANMAGLGLSSRCDLLRMEVSKAIPFLYRKKRVYDIIFMDPPYDKGCISETMRLLSGTPLGHTDTVYVVEHMKKEIISSVDGEGWKEIVQAKYGDTIITMLMLGTKSLKE